MPIFEYQCQDCNSKYEILHKSASSKEEVFCPDCRSQNSKKFDIDFQFYGIRKILIIRDLTVQREIVKFHRMEVALQVCAV